MQIRNILAGYPDPAAAKRAEAIEPAAGQSPATLEPHASSAAASAAAMAEILSRYDVTDISPLEFSQMIQRLFEAGTISQQELEQLAAVRMDLDTEGVEADESIDLLEFYAEKIQDVQRRLSDSETTGGNQQLAPLLTRLEWLEKFALIQSAPEDVGLDATA